MVRLQKQMCTCVRILEGGWCDQRQAKGRRHDSNELVEGGVAALGDGWLVVRPDGDSLIFSSGVVVNSVPPDTKP